jgi:hypothetical protein
MRRRVMTAKAGGMSEDAIALALGITRPTLQKHFLAELTTGAAQKRMDALEALFTQAKKGNVAAIKAVLLLNDAAGAPPRPEGHEDKPAPAAAPAALRLGKKEQANAAARTAADGTEWEGLLPGSTSVN